MGTSRKRPGGDEPPAEREMRAQEVLRANRELAAYFRGRRTEREARAALKIIKAFVVKRTREARRRIAAAAAHRPGGRTQKASPRRDGPTCNGCNTKFTRM